MRISCISPYPAPISRDFKELVSTLASRSQYLENFLSIFLVFHKRAFWKAPCRPIWRLFNQAHHQRWSDINQLIVSEHNGLIWTPTSPVMSRWVVTSDHRLSAPCQWSSLPTPSYLLIDSDHSQPHQWWGKECASKWGGEGGERWSLDQVTPLALGSKYRSLQTKVRLGAGQNEQHSDTILRPR